MKRRISTPALLASLVATASCFGGTSRSGDSGYDSTSRVVTRAEIDRGQWSDAYDLVSTVRPQWLRSRGTDSFADPGKVQVYVDGTRLGDVQLLKTLPTNGIQRLEWIDPVTAAGRWGMDHAHGVIYITYGREGPVGSTPDSPADLSPAPRGSVVD